MSTTRGLHFNNETWYPTEPSVKKPFTELDVQIRDFDTNTNIVERVWVPVNVTEFEVPIDLSLFKSKKSRTWDLGIIANSPDAIQTYQTKTSVTILPDRNDTGSVARLDSLNGGIEVRSSITNDTWKYIFPYSFYTSWDWISSTIDNSSAPENLTTFRSKGYNIIHPIPPGGDDPFDQSSFEQFLTICDQLELYVMYDMRHTYQKHNLITNQLSRLQHHPSLLLYYTADEPDGWCDPLNATKLSYNHIKSIDPYHPVSLVLNCANFYFEEYTSGADIILEDTYPIAVNTTFSTVYHTPCNITYGDCGCDNCQAIDLVFPQGYSGNNFVDITERVNNMYTYQTWLQHLERKKPVWGVPQAFWDQGSFWDRWPTWRESAVMSLLRINHGAKGIVAWMYPTNPEVEIATAGIAHILTSPEITHFLLSTKRIVDLEVVGGKGLIDAAAWLIDGRAFFTVVNQGYQQLDRVGIKLPAGVRGYAHSLWGLGGWSVKDGWLVNERQLALETSLIMVNGSLQ